jgi:hypothetical protein
MWISSSNTLGLCVALLLSSVLGLNMAAKDKTPSLINVKGTVFLIDKDSSTIMVDTKNGVRCLVVYSPDTKFKYGHSGKGKDSSWDQVKETNYISCAGRSDDKARLMAEECVHRESK